MDSVITIQNVGPAVPRKPGPQAVLKDGKPAPTGGKTLPSSPDLQSVKRAVKQINTYLTNS